MGVCFLSENRGGHIIGSGTEDRFCSREQNRSSRVELRPAEVAQRLGQKDLAVETLECRVTLKEHHPRVAQHAEAVWILCFLPPISVSCGDVSCCSSSPNQKHSVMRRKRIYARYCGRAGHASYSLRGGS